jgi:N-acetylmuramoyl-L-alanine amidase
VKLNWLLPGIFGSLLAALPAHASEILSWKFDQSTKHLDFVTDSSVKPEAQLLADPGKLVISLPETKLNQSTYRQAVGKGFRELRIGYNAENNTTNLVFELEPGYSIDPQQILIKADSSNHWSVRLPDAQITRGVIPTGRVSVFSETGALVVPERQVTTSVMTGVSSSPPPTSSSTSSPLIAAANLPVTISAIEVDTQYNRVLIRGSRQLTYSGGWDAKGAVYRINIPNARLASGFRFPSQNEINLQIFAVGANSVQIEVRRFDRNQIGPLVQYYAGQILSLPYGAAAKPVVIETRRPPVMIVKPTGATTIPAGRPVSRQVLVMIDPGHGGKDSGAIGLGGTREVDIILPIAKRVARILESQGIRTKLTRDSDYYVGLDERVALSNSVNATIFVSIHANSIDNRPDVNGLETYYYGPAGGKLAEVVHRNVLSTVTQKGFYLGNRNTRSARFLVLRKSQVPAILVETGYLTNEAEVARLRREDYQALEAEGIAKGIIEYLRQQ